MARSGWVSSVLAGFGLVVLPVSCGEANDGAPEVGGGGVSSMSGAGQAGSYEALGGGADGGADGEAGGAAGAPKCDPTPEDPAQKPCHLRNPSKLSCDEQDVAGWNGCYGGGCAICTQSLIDYPYYFDRHPCCQPNPTCSTHPPQRCSPLCPPPTELDKRPLCFNLER